jgi:hypothetical protein
MNRFLLLLSLCGLLAAPMMANDNEDRIKAMFEARKSASYPAQAFSAVTSMAVGQWVVYGLTDDDGERTIMRNAIIAHEGDEWTTEMTMINEDDVVIMQFTFKGLDAARRSGDADELEITRMALKTNDDEPMVMDGMMLSMVKGMYGKNLQGMTTKTTIEGDAGALTVVAGTFNGTTKATSKTSMTGSSEETTSWMHPAVPVYGVVKSTSSDEMTMELLDFGMTGAKPSF